MRKRWRKRLGVVVADLNLAGAEAVAKELTDAGLTALAVRMDVADEQEVEAGFDRMMEQFGSCDLVMSNAGVQIVHRLMNIRLRTGKRWWRFTRTVRFWSPARLSAA